MMESNDEPSAITATLSSQQYAKTRGTECPVCECENLLGNTVRPEGIHEAHRSVRCGACGATWEERFTLTGYVELRDVDGKPIPY